MHAFSLSGWYCELTSRTAAIKASVLVLYCAVEKVTAPRVKRSKSTPMAKYTPRRDARYCTTALAMSMYQGLV